MTVLHKATCFLLLSVTDSEEYSEIVFFLIEEKWRKSGEKHIKPFSLGSR